MMEKRDTVEDNDASEPNGESWKIKDQGQKRSDWTAAAYCQ